MKNRKNMFFFENRFFSTRFLKIVFFDFRDFFWGSKKKSKIKIFKIIFLPEKKFFFAPNFFLMNGLYENLIPTNFWSVSMKSATGI